MSTEHNLLELAEMLKTEPSHSIFKIAALIGSVPDGVKVRFDITDGVVVWLVQEKPAHFTEEQEKALLSELNRLQCPRVSSETDEQAPDLITQYIGVNQIELSNNFKSTLMGTLRLGFDRVVILTSYTADYAEVLQHIAEFIGENIKMGRTTLVVSKKSDVPSDVKWLTGPIN